jgi:hypothetical protein
MKNTVYAAVAASLAMFATSGIIALATAAPAPPATNIEQAEAELVRNLDSAIEARLEKIKSELKIVVQ